MEVERYKMVYTTIISKILIDELSYTNSKIYKEMKSDNIRILGNDFVKTNKNKGKLIINNKKYNLKEFVNINEIKYDKIKINMILSKGLSNISHIFENCAKLKEFSFCDDIIFIDDEAPLKLEEFNDNYNDFDSDEETNNCRENSLYKNLKTDNIYINCSTISTKTNLEENQDILQL